MNHESVSPPTLEFVVDYLQSRHDCHTVILYGSWARGDATEESDYDALGLRAQGPRVRDAFVHEGRYMDFFVYPDSVTAGPLEDFLHLRHGVVLCERDGVGTRFVQALAARWEAGPDPLPQDEAAARRVWWGKMLERARRGDLEGNYRRVWLLTQLLEDWFQVRGLWYRGPKESFAWLEQHEPALHQAFASALLPGATLESLAHLVELVRETP